MNHLIEAVAKLSGYAAFGIPVDNELKKSINDEALVELYNLSVFHDVAPLVATALKKLGLLPVSSVSDKFNQETITAFYRYQRLDYDIGIVYNVLKENNIDYLPLKGEVMRAFYPEPWLRTSCDADTLIRQKDIKEAEKLLTEALGFSKKLQSGHDISFVSSSNTVIELHFDLVEEKRASDANKILRNIWDNSLPAENNHNCYSMKNELFYFYHIAHIAKHFESGGCGIKPLIDLWLLNKQNIYYNEKTIEILREGGLLTFEKEIRNLCAVWFDKKAHTPLTLEIQSYIASGGVYGTADNSFSIKKTKSGGKIKYILSRIFLPYDLLKLQYPVIEKHRILTPFFEVYRWLVLLFGKKSAERKKYSQALNSADDSQGESIVQLLKQLDLHKGDD